VQTLYFGPDDVAYACITTSTRLTRIVSYEGLVTQKVPSSRNNILCIL